MFVQDYVFDLAKQRIVAQTLRETGTWHAARAEDIESGKVHLVYLDANNALVLGRGSLPQADSYPSRHYAYVLTPDWPKIPRQLATEPDESFRDIIPFKAGRVAGLLSEIGIKLRHTRSELYANCPATLRSIRTPTGRMPY